MDVIAASRRPGRLADREAAQAAFYRFFHQVVQGGGDGEDQGQKRGRR
jgi:hypothetical protein